MASKQYCYLEPPFPKNAYTAAVFVMDYEEIAFIYPLLSIYEHIADLQEDVSEIVSYNSHDDLEVADVSILIPIELNRRYPLREEFWKNPLYDYGEDYRIKEFLHFLAKPELYHLLVTPTYYDKKADIWTLWASLPFFSTLSEQAVEQFMLHSKHPVDMRAASAAIYQCFSPKRFNWQTGEISDLIHDDSLIDSLTVH